MVLKIWLTNYGPDLRTSLDAIVRDTPLEVDASPSSHLMECLHLSNLVLVGGRLPEALVEAGFWKLPKLQMVVTTMSARLTPPSPWQVDGCSVQHVDMGGVTDGVHKLMIHTKTKQGWETIKNWEMENGPPQDLRWVMKSGVAGTPAPLPQFIPLVKNASTVKYVQNNVVHSSGLYPMAVAGTKVYTEYGGNCWVIRPPSTAELLLMLDVPETLFKNLTPEESARLLQTAHVPGKVMQGVVECIATKVQSKSKEQDTGKRPLSAEREGVRPNKRPKFHLSADASLTHSIAYRRKVVEDDSWLGHASTAKRASRILSLSVVNEMDEESGEDEADHNIKATKSDGAKVRVELWDAFLIQGLHPGVQGRDIIAAAVVLRAWLLQVWRRTVFRLYVRWKATVGTLSVQDKQAAVHAARDCIRRCGDATWWNWDGGSRPFFWRWPVEYQNVVRDGHPAWFTASVVPWRRQQRAPDPDRFHMIKDKLVTIRRKGYVSPGKVASLMSFFEVPKGDDDVRMVYDGSASGLNEVLWAPWFPLPTVDCLLRAVEPGFHMADNDVAEMFHNFVLHGELQQYCGLDFTLYFQEELTNSRSIGRRLWERWSRLAMGLRNSPYTAVQGMLVAEEVILGNASDNSNVFRWSSVRLNLPGQLEYDPSKSWVCKIRNDGVVAADVFTYVDDIRCSAPTQAEAWRASQRTSSTLGFLGLQDAARKRRDPGEETGAWTGSVVWTSNGRVSAMTTQEKWIKTRTILQWISDATKNSKGIELKTLQSHRGFLVYVGRTYGSMVPYLKGIHATIDSWRPGRNQDGWKHRKSGKRKRSCSVENEIKQESDDLDSMAWEPKFGMAQTDSVAPLYVQPVPRLAGDLACLLELTNTSDPPRRHIRMKTTGKVLYGFGDASKLGFGTTIELPDKQMFWRYGQWRLDEEQEMNAADTGVSLIEERSSNYRELRNLVEAIKHAFDKGWLDDRELLMFTDNSTAEAAYFKGTSSSELLFNLVLRLRKIEMSGRCTLHLVHVAGTRMIWQGTDGLSRGDSNAGVMAGESMISFVPLHLGAEERSVLLIPWLLSWSNEAFGVADPLVVLLTPDDWPKAHVHDGIYIWMPPPAVADVAAEYMAKTIHKRPHFTHIFVCPRLMTARWMRLILKACDLVLTIPIGVEVWGVEQHEPLIIAIVFPLSRDKPWRHRNTPHCIHIRQVLQALFKSDFGATGPLLRECIQRARAMASV
jgi:hypothetical protein